MNAVQRLRQRNEFRSHRRKIATDLTQHPFLRLLPTLLEIPIEVIGPDGDPCYLSEAGVQNHRTILTGITGSGRSLALYQLAMEWATADSPHPLPLYITLPTFDDGRTAPEILITEWIKQLRDEVHTKPRGHLLPRAAARLPADQLHDCALLIDGWEELPISRQEVWRTVLMQTSQHWPETDIVIVLPLTEVTWPGFTSLAIPAPTPELISQWLQLMLPPYHYDAIVQSIQLEGSLAALSERLAEIAMLVWVVLQTDSLPKHRSDLYAQTLCAILEPHVTQQSPTDILAELQLLAAYDEIPSVAVAELVTPTPDGHLRFINPLFRMYLAAKQLVEETRFDLLRHLTPHEGLEVARFTITMVDNPTPVYEHLWNNGKPRVDDVITLGYCLYEQQTTPPLWSLRIVSALAQLARNQEQLQRHEAFSLLCQLTSTIDRLLYQLLLAPTQTGQIIPRLLTLLPNNLAYPHAVKLAFNEESTEEIGWAVADILTQMIPPPSSTTAVTAPEEPQALTRWIYVHVMQETHNRTYVMQRIQDGITPFFSSTTIGEVRLLRLAATLIDDIDAPTSARVDALSLLSHNDQPSALTVIERACHDLTVEVRQKALAMLVERDPSRAYTTLSRTVLDQELVWEIRLGAIQYLGTLADQGSETLVVRCATDTSLPLYAQLVSIATLQTHHTDILGHILHDETRHPEIRAAAARRVGAIQHTSALPDLLTLLSSPVIPTSLIEGICESLAILQDFSTIPILLERLEQTAANIPATLAIIQALGQLRANVAIAPLSYLLGDGAFNRLRDAVGHADITQPASSFLEQDALPEALAQRLALMLAESTTGANRPTTLEEFIEREANQLRETAAQALSAIGGDSTRMALLNALSDSTTGQATASIIKALASIDSPNQLETFSSILTTPDIDASVRWLTIDCLREHPVGVSLMRRLLAQPELDPFTRGVLAKVLGERGESSILPLLRQIADDPHANLQLRLQAITGLGMLDETESEVVLLRLVSAHREPDQLRAMAAKQLPSKLGVDGRRFLRNMLQNEQPRVPITVGILQALGQAKDREALPALLRYSQDNQADLVQAALRALAAIGDASVAPILVRVVQNTNLDHATRLQAVGALIELGGDSYQPLIQTYLYHAPLPLRMQALEHLIDTNRSQEEIRKLFIDRETPLMMRLRILETHASMPNGVQALLSILDDEHEHVHLRYLIINTLAEYDSETISPTLSTIAHRADTAIGLRLRCITLLGTHGTTDTCLTLSQLAENDHQSSLIRQTAIVALRHMSERDWHSTTRD